MKDTPTPRTDEAAMPIDRVDTISSRPCSVVHEDVYRQLERELAEMEEQCESWANQSMSWKLKADVLSRERVEVEELREIIDELKGRLRLAESERDTWQRLAVSSEMLRKEGGADE